jgi:hypothetical protein
MARRYRADREDGQSFIRWPSTSKSSNSRSELSSDRDLVVDRRRLYNYLDSLESLSGE